MIDIIVYLTDQQYQEEILSVLVGKHYIYHQASSVDEVIEKCSQDLIDLILVWPAQVEQIEDLLTVMQIKQVGYVPVIPVVKKSMNIIPILKIPVVDVIQIPLPRQEFYLILDRIVEQLQYKSDATGEQYWHGQLYEFSMIDLIRMIEVSERDAILSISVKEHKSKIFFKQGKVLRATLRSLESIKTLQKLVYLRKGNFQVQFVAVDMPDFIRVEKKELISKLNKQQEDQYTYLKSLQDLSDDLILAEYPPQDQIDREKKAVLDSCKNGMDVDELLISLDIDNLILLRTIKELVQDGYLVLRSDYNIMKKQKPERKKMEIVLDSISGLFKREKSELAPPKIAEPKAEPLPIIESKIVYNLPKVKKSVIQQIYNYFEGS